MDCRSQAAIAVVMGLRGNATWSQTFAWGITPFLIGDVMKLLVAAIILPLVWKFVGDARA
ncbi:MAG: biotin transporter BioY, partial [Pseudomonadota bacterium]